VSYADRIKADVGHFFGNKSIFFFCYPSLIYSIIG